MPPLYWLPPVAWMAVIFVLSTDMGNARHTGDWLEPVLRALLPSANSAQLGAVHGAARKAAHVTEYAVLAALWFRALLRGRGWPARPAGWAALGLAVVWAVTDEWHQAFVPSRTASAGDVAFDAVGAALVVLVARAGWRAAARGATTALLWIAGLGGAGLLALNVALGMAWGVLGFSVPVAALVLVLRHRRAGRVPPTGPGSASPALAAVRGSCGTRREGTTALPPGDAPSGRRADYVWRSRARASMCGVCGNMSTGCTHSRR